MMDDGRISECGVLGDVLVLVMIERGLEGIGVILIVLLGIVH